MNVYVVYWQDNEMSCVMAVADSLEAAADYARDYFSAPKNPATVTLEPREDELRGYPAWRVRHQANRKRHPDLMEIYTFPVTTITSTGAVHPATSGRTRCEKGTVHYDANALV